MSMSQHFRILWVLRIVRYRSRARFHEFRRIGPLRASTLFLDWILKQAISNTLFPDCAHLFSNVRVFWKIEVMEMRRSEFPKISKAVGFSNSLLSIFVNLNHLQEASLTWSYSDTKLFEPWSLLQKHLPTQNAKAESQGVRRGPCKRINAPHCIQHRIYADRSCDTTCCSITLPAKRIFGRLSGGGGLGGCVSRPHTCQGICRACSLSSKAKTLFGELCYGHSPDHVHYARACWLAVLLLAGWLDGRRH